MSRPRASIAIAGSGLAAHVAASTLAEAGLEVVLLGGGSPGLISIWNGLGSIFGPASPRPADSAGAVERRTAVDARFEPSPSSRWERLFERRSNMHPYRRLELDREAVDRLTDDALAALPAGSFTRTATVVPGPRGMPYAADLLFPSLRALDLRSGQRVGLVRLSAASGWNADAVASQLERTPNLSARSIELPALREAPDGHGIHAARWLERRWEEVADPLVDQLRSAADSEDLDLLALPPVIGPTLPAHDDMWSTLSSALEVSLAEYPPSADPVFGWRLFRTLQATDETSEEGGGAGAIRHAPEADTIEFDGERVGAVIDRSGERHPVDALLLASGRWFGEGLPAEPPLVEPLTDAPIWLDGAPLPDDRAVFPPDLLGDLPWEDHRLFRAGLQIDAAGRLLDRDGAPYADVYAAGRILGGFNPFHDGCSMGVELATGRSVAHQIAAEHAPSPTETRRESERLETS